MKHFILIVLILGGHYGYSADHLDGPAVTTDPATDITDVYAWMQDADRINLIMNVSPLATTESSFSTAAKYIFHVNSLASYGAAATETLLVCTFGATGNVTCFLSGTSMVADVDASAEAGVTNTDGTFRIFTGLRNDPFFFDLNNFNAARETVRDAASSLTFDGAGCPTLDNATRTALVNTLTGAAGGVAGATSPSVNFFAAVNTLSIVVQMDRTLLGAGPVYAVSGATHRF